MEQEGDCAIGNWCVSQWAFAGYIQKAGGCDAIVEVQCDATNMAALRAYRKEASSDPSIKEALRRAALGTARGAWGDRSRDLGAWDWGEGIYIYIYIYLCKYI